LVVENFEPTEFPTGHGDIQVRVMVMTLHKLTAGDGYLYLVRQVAAADSTQRGRSTLADYYSAKGEAPGRWLGRGLTALAGAGSVDIRDAAEQQIWSVEHGSAVTEAQMRALFGEGLHPNADRIESHMAGRGIGAQRTASQLGRKFYVHDGEPEFARRLAIAFREHNAIASAHWNTTIEPGIRARIRTHIAHDLFESEYGRTPSDSRELSGFIARHTRARTTAVAGYDLTFSPVKSVSALWAIAPLAVADQIEAAHDAAVADVLVWLQDHAAFTRLGTNGVAQVDTEGLIAAAFTHRDSRAGDPDLHTHVAVSNKVCHIDDNGTRRWLALDGQPLHRVTVAASELYNTRLEAHLTARLGVRFVETSRGRDKRSVREIAGMRQELLSRWSSRRAAIETRTALLAGQFQADHGREPTHVEIIALAQQATLETREDKHEPRSLAQQRQTWRTQAIEVLGRDGLQQMLTDTRTQHRHDQTPVVDERWVVARAGEVIATVARTRATWQRHHVRAEALRALRSHRVSHNVALADRITDTALSTAFSLPHACVRDGQRGEPVALRRKDGASVYNPPRRAALHQPQHPCRRAADLDRCHTRRRPLRRRRRHRCCARRRDRTRTHTEPRSSRAGRRDGDLWATCSARAGTGGTGKTTAMAALAHAWRSSGGHVLGLAPTADAAIVLGEDLGAPTDTVDKYVHTATAPRADAPNWFRQVGPDTLIIVDEAGRAATSGLDVLITDALAKGASVRLIGDDGQLSSISAGGVLRDIAEATEALTLSEVVRFKSPAEAAAGLALHDGDPAGIAFYTDHHRIHVGTDDTAADMAYVAWRDDLARGVDSILLAPTNDIITTLNARARADRLATTGAPNDTPSVVLADGLHASVGDTIRTRRNNRRIRLGTDDFVRNGYRYTITRILPGGAIEARHLRSGRHIALPADYLAEHVTLGYAATIDSAQGITAGSRDTKGSCHVVGSDTLTRQHLYVALTRGTDQNHLYLSTAESDPHRLLSPKATHPDTAVDVLTRALARDGAQVSATTAARHAADPAARLQAAADMFYDALGAAAEHHLGPHTRHQLDTLADDILPDLSSRDAWPVLRRHLALLTLSGADPRTLLTRALAEGGIADAADPAAVLDYRIDPAGTHSAGIGVLRWLPAIPAALANDPPWGDYLARRETLVATLADDIRARAHAWTHATAPPWARPLISVNTALTAEIAVFRAATATPDADTRLTGARQYPVRTRSVQAALQRHATTGIGRRTADTTRWNDLIDTLDPRLRADAYWPQLATKLAHAARTTTDLRQILIDAARQNPLPDEQPAAALWWRIAGSLSTTTTLATTRSRLRPAWMGDLDTLFGTVLAETICADPAWPGLVAAINAAHLPTWTPRDLLAVAAERLADDDDQPIAPGEYARLLTYTIDAFTHRLTRYLATVTELPPLPEHAPPEPDDEAHLPPDPQDDDPGTPEPDALEDTAFCPAGIPTYEYGDGPIDGLAFEVLSDRRPPRQPLITIEVLQRWNDQYRTTCTELDRLDAQIRDDRGPAMLAAADTLIDMRRRIDADRPYAHALTQIMSEWLDADVAYNDTLMVIEHARRHLNTLLKSPDVDELDIASARADLAFHNSCPPETYPGQIHQNRFKQARKARQRAADGNAIPTEQDIADVRTAARDKDLAAHQALKTRRDNLQHQITQAEQQIAAAFADAHAQADATIDALHAAAQAELALLNTATRMDPDHAPLTIPDTAVGDIEPAIATQLAKLAAQPHQLSYVHADSTRPDTIATLTILRTCANAEDRKLLWLSITEERSIAAGDQGLADHVTTIDHAHQDIDEQLWDLGPHPIIIIDNPAGADPEHLADLTHHITRNGARAIIIDLADGIHGPSTTALSLLAGTLPWATHLDATDRASGSYRPRTTPAITLAAEHDRTQLSQQWQTTLRQHDTTTRAIRSNHRLHITLTWNTRHPDIEQGLEAEIDD
jgi:conjugative relaxase-like TrwC/TraI family protein